MKQGKNKPLEAEEIEFLDSVVAHKMEAERRKRAEEAQELQSFQVGLATAALRLPADLRSAHVAAHA